VGYHAVNILLHGLNALLVWALLSTLGIPGAWVAAWLFALHPVEVESVAWISELKNTLSTFFYLSAGVLLVRGEKKRRSWWADDGPAFLLYTAAVLSKSVTVTLPLSFLVIHTWVRDALDRKTFVRLLPFFAVSLGVGGFTLHMEHDVIGALGNVCDFSLPQRILLAGRSVWFYIGKLVYPAPLVFIYPRWVISTRDVLAYLYPAGVLALGGLLLGESRRWGKLPFACFLFFIITLSPALGFTNFYPMRFSFVADHFQYLAGLGMFTLAGWLLSNTLDCLGIPRTSPGGMAVLGLLVINLTLATAQASRKYADSESLWRHTLAYNPDSAIAHHNLGIACSEKNEWREALAWFAVRAGHREDALHQYEEAIRLGVQDPQILKDYAALRDRRVSSS
jgi:hypothetical protein